MTRVRSPRPAVLRHGVGEVVGSGLGGDGQAFYHTFDQCLAERTQPLVVPTPRRLNSPLKFADVVATARDPLDRQLQRPYGCDCGHCEGSCADLLHRLRSLRHRRQGEYLVQLRGRQERMAAEQARSEAEGDVLPWTVAEFYRGQSVLLTGGSGFVGRVLLEKLLFYCPDIDTVYVLLRPRKGLSVQERLHKLLDVPLFDRVRAQRPEALGRLQAVEGDSAQPSLALAEADALVLAERVSVVFHLAASVRFDDPLITAVRTNACATRELLELATRMSKLKEKLYPAAGDWRSILALVEAQGQSDPSALRALTTKILGPHCNTYTFTKNLAEHIVDHYSDRLPVGIVALQWSVLLTGGSGFVGRVLLEKLLFYCPDIDTVYVLLRPRKGLSVQERLHKLLDLFDRVRAQRPEALGRLQAVEGDSAQPGLALAEADARVLAERVSVVFHLAASVRFDDPLITAVRTNACATRDLLELATRMTMLKCEFEEKLYPAAGDWRSILALVEAQGQSDPVALRALTTKILGPYCNTYTYTKNLTEHIVDHYSARLPVGILRPSVVVATARDPFPGWIDNFYGPMGLMVGFLKGVVHTCYADPDCYIDYVPCDIVAKGIVMCSCEVARKGGDRRRCALRHRPQTHMEEQARSEAEGDVLPWTVAEFYRGQSVLLTGGSGFVGRVLLEKLLFYCPDIDTVYVLLRPRKGLSKRLRPEDREGFCYQLENIIPEAFFRDALHGTRRYLMKEPDSNLPQAIRAYKRITYQKY
ncbi:Putative fatty acyl-CoA reductase CG5065 [Gryllus bimaculatus]|nr:Putative fatty acyl-CoA reductase CG5065 [Gryllus bimaculatus]